MRHGGWLCALALAGCDVPSADRSAAQDAAVPAEAHEDDVGRLPPASAPPLAADKGQPVPDLPPLVRLQEIPPDYLGEWNVALKDCGTGRNDSRLMLEPSRVRFYESVGEVTSVRMLSAAEIEIEARMQGEGGTWASTHRFRLNGNRLTAPGDGNAQTSRLRCPAEPKSGAAHSGNELKQGAS